MLSHSAHCGEGVIELGFLFFYVTRIPVFTKPSALASPPHHSHRATHKQTGRPTAVEAYMYEPASWKNKPTADIASRTTGRGDTKRSY